MPSGATRRIELYCIVLLHRSAGFPSRSVVTVIRPVFADSLGARDRSMEGERIALPPTAIACQVIEGKEISRSEGG